MKMRYSIFVIFILFNFTTYSVKSQECIINLDRYKTNLLPVQFSIDSVIDACEHNRCIGFAYTGIANTKNPAFSNQSIQSEFQKLFLKYKNKDANEHCIIRINRIYIFEQLYDSYEDAYALVNISFIIKKGNKYYEKFQANSSVVSRSIDATLKHEENIINAINRCFADYEARKEILNNSTQLVETDLAKNPFSSQKFKIEKTKSFPKGIYKSFYDFRDCTADTTIYFENEILNDHEFKYSSIKDKFNSKIDDFWGFSDGKQNYVKINNKIYPIKIDHNRFYILKNAPIDMVSGSVGLLFGLVGVLIINSINLANNDQIEYNIDFTTGTIIPKSNLDDFAIDGKIIVSYNNHSMAGEDIELIVDGEKRCTLSTSTYYVIRCKPEMKKVDFCLRSKKDQLCENIEPRLFETEIYDCRIRNDKLKFEPNVEMIENQIIMKIEDNTLIRIKD